MKNKATIGSVLGRGAWATIHKSVKAGEKERERQEIAAAKEKKRKAKERLKPVVSAKLRKHKERI